MEAAQSEPPVPQFRAAPVTVPPVGRGLIVIEYGGPLGRPAANVAVQLFAASISTVVVGAVPVQLPPQLVKEYPDAAEALSVTDVDAGTVTWHTDPPAPHDSPLPLTVPFTGVGEMESW
jgi:ABC-type molybdate transport system permease subunit